MMSLLAFYFAHMDVTIDQLSAASRRAYTACHTAYNALSPPEQNLTHDFFSTPRERRTEFVNWYEANLGKSPEYIYETIRKLCRMVAEEMGIADKKGGDDDA